MGTTYSRRLIPRDEQSRCFYDNLFLPKFHGDAEVQCTNCGMVYLPD